MDASTPVEVSRLQQPEVMRVEVAHRHRVSSRCTLFKIESLELGHARR